MTGLQAALHAANQPTAALDDPAQVDTADLPLSLQEVDAMLPWQDNREPYLPSAQAARPSVGPAPQSAKTAIGHPTTDQPATASDALSGESKGALSTTATRAWRGRSSRHLFIAAALLAAAAIIAFVWRDHAASSRSIGSPVGIPSIAPATATTIASPEPAQTTDAEAESIKGLGEMNSSAVAREELVSRTHPARSDVPRRLERAARARIAQSTAPSRPPDVTFEPPSATARDDDLIGRAVSDPSVLAAPASHPEPAVSSLGASAEPARSTVPAGHARRGEQQAAAEEASSSRDVIHDAERVFAQATMAAAAGHHADARERFEEVLKIDSNHSGAAAGLLTLNAHGDPYHAAEKLQEMIARSPTPDLYFALGNVLAIQAHWHPASLAYERARALAPDNADYAYNLAVAHEHLAQYRQALQQYRAALNAIREADRPGFDPQRVQQRIARLERHVDDR